MDSTVFHGSPLAEYLEGQEIVQPELEASSNDTAPTKPISNFAPKRISQSAQDRLRRILTTPLHLHVPYQSQTWQNLQESCLSAVSTGITKGEDERFLEQLRYSIITSQLLVPHQKPSIRSAHSFLGRTQRDGVEQGPENNAFSPLGGLVTALASFVVVWIVHILLVSVPASLSAKSGLVVPLVCLCAGFVALFQSYQTRLRSQRARQDVVFSVAGLIAAAHALDAITNAALSLIQEVEVVARGYDIHILPPISRLEQRDQDRRCKSLRFNLAGCLTATEESYIDGHFSVTGLCNAKDLDRYHEIYELSREDFASVTSRRRPQDLIDAESLKSLRYASSRLFVARQILLCDLLAISSGPGRHNLPKWQVVSDIARAVTAQLQAASDTTRTSLESEDKRRWGNQAENVQMEPEFFGDAHAPVPPLNPDKERAKAQMRRLETMSNGIRELYARMHVLRDEANSLVESTADGAELTATLTRQYDMIGTELRNLLSEWDKGRNTMLLTVEGFHRFSSRSSSGLRSPLSPVPSLGGMTAVEGSPADALRALTGEGPQKDRLEAGTSDEELFEAVAAPRARMTFTREEKVARMQEDRRKRATLQERTDVNTNMLRELETVIKHRPRGRTASRIICV